MFSPIFCFLSWILANGLGSMFLVVPLFHLAVSSVQLTTVMLFFTAYSIFHNKAPTWLQESPKPAMPVHQAFSTVPSFVHMHHSFYSRSVMSECLPSKQLYCPEQQNVKFCPHYHFESNCNFVNSWSFSFLPHQLLSTWLYMSPYIKFGQLLISSIHSVISQKSLGIELFASLAMIIL